VIGKDINTDNQVAVIQLSEGRNENIWEMQSAHGNSRRSQN